LEHLGLPSVRTIALEVPHGNPRSRAPFVWRVYARFIGCRRCAECGYDPPSQLSLNGPRDEVVPAVPSLRIGRQSGVTDPETVAGQGHRIHARRNTSLLHNPLMRITQAPARQSVRCLHHARSVRQLMSSLRATMRNRQRDRGIVRTTAAGPVMSALRWLAVVQGESLRVTRPLTC
jgi:hypothetical protein